MKSKVLEVGKKIKGKGEEKGKKKKEKEGEKEGGKRKKEEVRDRKGGERKKKSLWDPNHNTLTYQIYHCNSLTTQNAMFHGFH